MKKLLIVLALLVPSLSFAADDATIRASILQTLLTQFVSQVNALDSMQAQVALSANPGQFKPLTAVLATQLQFTTQSLAGLLNGVTDTIAVPSVPSVNFGSAGAQGSGTIQATMPAEDKSEITVDVSPIQEPTVDYPLGYYRLNVRVLGANGKTTPVTIGDRPTQPIAMTINGKTENNIINTGTEDKSLNKYVDMYHTFTFGPEKKGSQEILFTSGNLTKSITIEVK